MRVAFLGFGLIGGSIARALAGRGLDLPFGGSTLVAWTPSGDGPRRALAEGVITEAPADPASAIDGAEIVILAAPPLVCLDLVDRLAGDLHAALGPGTIVTDVASTKASIIERARADGLRFVGGHPMAGRETMGYDAGSEDLFDGHPWIVVPAADGNDAVGEAAAAQVEALARACRAQPVRMSAEQHDAIVASISHMPLLLSAALVEAVAGRRDRARPDWEVTRSLAASGWHDMTRLARGDPQMAAGILATNAGAIGDRLRDLRAVLDEWLEEVDALAAGNKPDRPETDNIRRRFEAVRERLVGGQK